MTNYPTNVSDSQWQYISKFLDTDRSRKYELREIVNAILYVINLAVSGGCFQEILHHGSWCIIILILGKRMKFSS